jgi:signal transduction histidine kinase
VARWRFWALCLALLCGSWPVQAELIELRQAIISSIDGAQGDAEEVRLPYSWDREHRGEAGTAAFEVHFPLDRLPLEPYAVYFARIGNRAEIWLNGVLLSRFGDLDKVNDEDYAKAPQYILIPAQLLQRENVFRILLHADAGRRGGLSTVQIGPEVEVRVHHQSVYRWLVNGTIAVSVFSLVIGAFAVLVWATQTEITPGEKPRRDALYLSAGIAEISWMLHLADTALTNPPLPWPWWGLMHPLTYAGWFCGSALFCHHVAGWHKHASMKWLSAAVIGLAVTSVPAAWVALNLHENVYLTTWYGFASFLFVAYAVVYFIGAVMRPKSEHVLVAMAGVFTVMVGFRDWLVIRASSNFSEISWMRYASVLFGMALSYIVITRFRAASMQARDLMVNMAEKVRQKEEELAASYHQLEQLAREQERAAERTRILRDMHDGVGAHISAAIRQLQSGRANETELLQTLRDSLDQLKMSIDAMNLPPGDITTLLANLRYRLEPRFKASDIALVWDVDFLLPLSGLDGKAMRQLQYMVFEALSNVLQHAHASELRIELRALGDSGACLRLIDNGRGFDPERMQKTGLSSLRERASSIGAQLDVSSQPGQTVVEIRLV